jgi:hypothetical protein
MPNKIVASEGLIQPNKSGRAQWILSIALLHALAGKILR